MPRSFDVLVTGGAGFIGSHLVDGLVESGRTVLVLDNFSTGKTHNLTRALASGRVFIRRIDLSGPAELTRFVKRSSAIVHLAAESRAAVSAKNPERTNRINVKGTLKLLKAASGARVTRFVFASSAAVYGESETKLQTETDSPKPIGVYGASKLGGEAYCGAFHAQFEVPTTILRPFNVYGPRQGSTEEATVISAFVNRIKRNLPLQVFGDGLQTRDFVHVHDVANAIIRAVDSPRAVGEVFNVGTGVRTSILELAQMMSTIAGKQDLTPKFLPARKGDIRNSCANVEKMQNILGVRSKIDLKEGLRTLPLSPRHSAS